MPSADRIGKGWRATWRDGNGKMCHSRAPYFAAYNAALNHAQEQERLARLGIDTAGAQMRWGDWKPLWLAVRDVGAGTDKNTRGTIERHLTPRWGEVALGSITRYELKVWVKHVAQQVAPATVAKIFYLLSASLDEAVEQQVLQANPCVRIKLPDVPETSERFLRPAEFWAVIEELDEPYRTAAILLVGTGLRFGEMAGLHWHRVDLDAGVLQVVETWSRAGRHITAYPKGKRRRRVPLPSWVASAIGEPGDERDCGLEHVSYGEPCRSGLVVPAPRGGALDSKNMLRRHWYPAMDAAGIDRARQHDLRHTTASWLAQDGEPIEVIADVLGHTQLRTTQRYRHMGDSHLDRARSAIENRGPVPDSVPDRDLKIVARGF